MMAYDLAPWVAVKLAVERRHATQVTGSNFLLLSTICKVLQETKAKALCRSSGFFCGSGLVLGAGCSSGLFCGSGVFLGSRPGSSSGFFCGSGLFLGRGLAGGHECCHKDSQRCSPPYMTR